MQTEVIPRESVALTNDKEQSGYASLLAAAVQRGLGVAEITQLVGLQERWEAREAAKAWAAAVKAFKAECPTIFKGRGVDSRGSEGKEKKRLYSYADYSDIKRVTAPLEAKHGITTSFSFDQGTPGKLVVTCKVTVGMHTEAFTSVVGLPKGLNTNEAQDSGAAMSYGRRYAYIAALDIVVSGEDNDANALNVIANEETLNEIRALIEELKMDTPKFWEWVSMMKPPYEITRVDDIPQARAAKILHALKQRKARPQ